MVRDVPTVDEVVSELNVSTHEEAIKRLYPEGRQKGVRDNVRAFLTAGILHADGDRLEIVDQTVALTKAERMAFLFHYDLCGVVLGHQLQLQDVLAISGVARSGLSLFATGVLEKLKKGVRDPGQD